MSNEIVQNDNGTVLRFTVTDDNGIVDIRNSTVNVLIKYKNIPKTKQATLVDPQNGKCEITLSNEDTAQVGAFPMQITVKFVDGKEFTSSNIERLVVSKKL